MYSRYDTVSKKVCTSCYSGFNRGGDLVETELIVTIDAALSRYLLDAGSLLDFPDIGAISTKVTATACNAATTTTTHTTGRNNNSYLVTGIYTLLKFALMFLIFILTY